MKKTKILAIGQVPPPYGGQNVMFAKFATNKYEHIEIFLLNTKFSKTLGKNSKMEIEKFYRLLVVYLKLLYYKIRHRINVIYYLTSGPNRVSLYKDIAILFLVRRLYKKVIFHFHAAGLSDVYNSLSGIEKYFIKKSMFYPDLTIQISKLSPNDGGVLLSKRIEFVANGIEPDVMSTSYVKEKEIPIILFVGLLKESKGVSVLLNALDGIKDRKFKAMFMGEFESSDYKNEIVNFVVKNKLEDKIEFLGVKTGKDKEYFYKSADIFCFPTFFECENFPVVLLEAMKYSLPIISTNWRAIPEIIEDGKTGILVPIKEPNILREKIELLLNNCDLRKSLGSKAREKFLMKYTLDKHLGNMEKSILEIL